jgi:chromate reductase
VVISTPEYAFGVPGALKNALDWTVSSGEFNEKHVIAISASPLYEGGSKALASLLLTLGALGTKMSERSSMSIANVAKKINSTGEISDEQTLKSLEILFDHLIDSINKKKFPGRDLQ